jgi:predicted transcriptional regulator
MSDKQEKQVQTAVRFSESMLDRVGKIAERMSRPGIPVTRTDAIRAAVFEWVEWMEAGGKEGKKR